MPIWYAFEKQFASPSTLATIYAVTYLVSVVLELPTGALADLIGRKYIVCLGYLIQGGSWIFISQSQNVWWLWIGYSISQVGFTFVSGANTALLYDTLKELKKESIFNVIQSKNELVYRIGITLAGFTGGYIFIVNQRLPYVLVGVATIIAAIITWFEIEPHIDSEKFTLKNYIKQTRIGFQELWKTTYIRDFSFYYISVGGITWYYLFFLLNVFMTDVGFNPVHRGWITAVNSMLVAFVALMVTRHKLLSRNATYIFFPIVMLFGFLFAPFLTSLAATISLFLIYLAGITRFIFLDQYANEEFDSKYRATAISALNMAISFVYFLLSFSMNPILTRWGSGWVMFTLGVITLFTTVPSTIILLRKKVS
ncbi:MAG: Major facilitator superfamily [Candidatus Gottesmanbacteria bacterium GW2011_GWA1_44_24b]|uniref:Major facilitator superfamily n=1 Tax=Candidatus Gottesmanbacteria bacterium GW2011_GWA1_44_24b TaxID=1618437 RepID=A0A0G1ICY8_9BACT|nr:MAG: Major facilitator superfamily [Candidatus Gottesmanbacteria bacterium GW2011_GWA1_44_24b]